MESQYKIVIIGAGPAGLAVGGSLRHAGINSFTILERSNALGATWRNHYDRLHLHTVKQLSHLPHLAFPEEYPLYVSRQQVVAYLESYAAHFNLDPQLETEVRSIEKHEGKWLVETNQGSLQARHVIVATGVNKTPFIPEWPGSNTFSGSIIHSRFYKNPNPYKGQKVLVIGMGNTGAEVALDLAEQGVHSHLAVRSPISLVPRDLNGQPVQLTAKRLAKLPFGLGDWLGSQIRKIYFGNLDRFGLRISKMHPAVQLRETGKTPVVDIGTIAAIKQGKIIVHHNVKQIDGSQVEFEEGVTEHFDSIILATGYRADLEKMIPGITETLDQHALPDGIVGEGNFENMYFLGFDNYKLGGILGTIRSDSLIIAQTIQSRL